MTELLWGRQPAPSRGPKPAITLTGIAEAAIRIADAEGLDAVSMQRIAGELPVTKMALYRYVPGKTELLAVMSDLAMGAPPERPGLAWRAALQTWAMDLYAGFTRHPWLLQSTIGRRLLGPNELAWMEQGLTSDLTDVFLASLTGRSDPQGLASIRMRLMAPSSIAFTPDGSRLVIGGLFARSAENAIVVLPVD